MTEAEFQDLAQGLNRQFVSRVYGKLRRPTEAHKRANPETTDEARYEVTVERIRKVAKEPLVGWAHEELVVLFEVRNRLGRPRREHDFAPD